MNEHVAETTVIDVGKRPSSFHEWETIRIHFHDFKRLPKVRPHHLTHPSIRASWSCLGHEWTLIIYPRGRGGHGSSGEYVGVDLHQNSYGIVSLDYCISALGPKGEEVARHCTRAWFDSLNEQFSDGTSNFAKRSHLLQSLSEGTLIIEIRMALGDQPPSPPLLEFFPPNPFSSSVQELFLEENTADILIQVIRHKGNTISKMEEQQKENPTKDLSPVKDTETNNNDSQNKKQKTESPTHEVSSDNSFHVHRLILEKSAPTLAALCESCNIVKPLQINDMDPTIFRIVLKYVYGKKISDDEFEANAKEIIDAADKYGVVNLKLEAEAYYVRATTINFENLVDNLLYSDAKNCALLKEELIEFIMENSKKVIEKISFQDVPGTMLSELLAAVNRGKGEQGYFIKCLMGYNAMRVSELRRLCFKSSLPVDGSREMMIAALKRMDEENSQRQEGGEDTMESEDEDL